MSHAQVHPWPAAMLAAIAAPTAAEKAAVLKAAVLPVDGDSWSVPAIPNRPGRSADLREGPAPRRRRGIDDPASRRRFLHAIWHIEVSAVDLACLASLCGVGMPTAFHADFIRIACEEALHADTCWLAVRPSLPAGHRSGPSPLVGCRALGHRFGRIADHHPALP